MERAFVHLSHNPGYAMQTSTLFEREALTHMPALQHYAFQLCRNSEYSQDLVQETMLKAYRYFHTYKQGTNCRAWLFQICKNSYINDYRRRQYAPVTLDFQEYESGRRLETILESDREAVPVLSDDSVLTAHAEFLSDEVAASLEQIPQDYRTALILSDIEGFTYDEIAEFMQAPIGTIRSRIHRGRKMLAARLGDYAIREGVVSRQAIRN